MISGGCNNMIKNHNTILQDQLARDQIITDFSSNFLVEASAGSGKTSCLVKRMVSLIKNGIYSIDQIAAITFTRKAAFELKERFQQEIEIELQGNNSFQENSLLLQAITDFEQCYVGTIHSFCAGILRERPIEAGLDPTFKELNEIDNILLMEQAWEQYLTNLSLRDAICFQNLATAGIQIQDLRDSYKKVCQFPEIEIMHKKVKSPELASTVERLFSFCAEAKRYIPEIEPEKGYDFAQQAILQVEKLKKYSPYREKDFYKIVLLEPFTKNFAKSGRVVLKKWLSKEKAKEYRDIILPQLSEQYVQPTMEKWREYCHDYSFNLIKPAVDYYQQIKERYSLVNFQDLLLKTSSLLCNNPAIRQFFQQKYRTILVDEFQDTDPIQAEIIFYLTGEEDKEKDWKKLIPRAGSLFIVGDPQQSIYHFRRADINVYKQVKKLIANSNGKIVRLTTNFRSLHSIGNFVNSVFTGLFEAGEAEFQTDYVAMQTTREDKKGFLSGVYQTVLTEKGNKAEIIESDANSIASLIREWIDNGEKIIRTEAELDQGKSAIVDYRDFMVLLRYKSGMEIYSKVFKEYGIPVIVSGSNIINNSYYLQELLKLLRLLKDPENQVLLVAVLRGIFYGFSDEELYRYKKAGGSFNYNLDFSGHLEEDLREKIELVSQQLKKYYHWCTEYPPSVALEKIIIQSGLLPYFFSGIEKKDQGNEVFFILEYLREAEMKDFLTFDGMTEQLEKLYLSGLEEEFNILVEENSVRLMNLHKAKGLEAPIVFLSIPYQTYKPVPEYYIERLGNNPKGHFVIKKPQNYGNGKIIAQPQKWKEYCQIETSYQDAEEARLLYVAATRAKNMLIISSMGADYQNNKSNPWQPLLKDNGLKVIMGNCQGDSLKTDSTKGHLSVTEFEIDMNKAEQDRKGLFLESYSEKTISRQIEFTETGHPLITTVDKGGKKWGSTVHKIFEYIIKADQVMGKDQLNWLIKHVLKQNGISISRCEELYKIVQNFLNSHLYSRVKKAKQFFSELPFNLKLLPDDPFYKEIDLARNGENTKENMPIVITGTIDLVFQEDDGWVIVDYKTDCPAKEGDYNKLRKFYELQISSYSQIWQKIGHQRVKECLIYFVEEQK